VADRYRSEFQRLSVDAKITLPVEPYRDRGLTNHHIYHQYVIRTERRDALQDHLTRKEIGTAIYYPLALHEQECFRYLGYQAGDFPEAERAGRETLALPIYPELSAAAQRYVAESIAEFF
jgi:dTDP-4-amino-4,6-dideoxygalactose transaminase